MVHDLPKLDGGRQQQPPTINAPNIPYHLFFPTPIPEPPKIISSKPLVSDVSITSDFAPEAGRSAKARVKLKTTPTVRQPTKVPPPPLPLRSKQPPPLSSTTNAAPLTTTIQPTEEYLQKLRRKYGILKNDRPVLVVDDRGYSSDEEDEDEDEDDSVVCLEEKSSSRRPRLQSSKNNNNNNNNNVLQSRLHQVQSDLRQQFEKLQKPQQPQQSEPVDLELSSSSGVSSDSAATTAAATTKSCTCNKTTAQQVPPPPPPPPSSNRQPKDLHQQNHHHQLISSSSSADKEKEQLELAAYIRKQDQQLQQISRQIDELLRIQKHQTVLPLPHECLLHQTKSSSSSQPKQTTTTAKSIQTMTTESIIHETTEYRPLPNDQSGKNRRSTTAKHDAKSSSRNSSSSTDSAKADLRSLGFRLSRIEKARRELKQSLLLQSSDADGESLVNSSTTSSSSSSADMYTNMISTINSILVRNGSFEESVSRQNSTGDSGSGGSGNRSSCSEPEQMSASFQHRKPLKASSPKQQQQPQQQQHHKRTTIIRQTKIAAAASSASPQTAQSFRRRRYLHSEQSLYIEKLASKYEIHEEEEEEVFDVSPPPRSPTEELLVRYHLEREHDAAVYCLSEHNTSIATKDYLEKKTSKPSTGPSLKKPPPQVRSKLSLVNEEENEGEEENLPGKSAAEVEAAAAAQKRLLLLKAKTVREVKSRTAAAAEEKTGGGRYSRILDLEAIKSLPKLT
ncbi:hypothetical protein TYRP_018199 [Tyrophagus putrescentiae]|nr:hypothetical protein TYRP_018199 [Tyrophagus putrescentiae]